MANDKPDNMDALLEAYAGWFAANVLLEAVDGWLKALRGEQDKPKVRVIALGPAPEPVEIIVDDFDFGEIKH